MQNCSGAVVVALYGPHPKDLWPRLEACHQAGVQVIAVNNNPPDSSEACPQRHAPYVVWIENHNEGGLARGLNRGVAEAIRRGSNVITLLDQDSELDAPGLLLLQERVMFQNDIVVGPAVWDLERQCWHTQEGQPRMLITSGTTFSTMTWHRCGPYREWMEIDFIDHEWCSRARAYGLKLLVETNVILAQHFGERHPHPLAHRLGLQLYSPYRRAIALRNLRWLALQQHVPIDIRLKEAVKMILKPLLWVALEPRRKQTLVALQAGLRAPLHQPFPRDLLKAGQ